MVYFWEELSVLETVRKTLKRYCNTDIPKGVVGAKWYEVPGIWWNTVEKLSWTMLGKQYPYGCKFQPVMTSYQ